MSAKAFQDYYTDEVSVCYGCGRLNDQGLQIKSYWDGQDAVCHFDPKPYHTAIAGYVYGGLIASLIDCHCTGTAAAAAHQAEGGTVGDGYLPRFVTASLHVDYLRPTPIDAHLELRARPTEVKGRKVKVSCQVLADGVETARGEAVLVRMPEDWLAGREQGAA